MTPSARPPLILCSATPHTHTAMAGAVLSAECVVSGLRALPHHPLDKYLSPKGKAIKPYKA